MNPQEASTPVGESSESIPLNLSNSGGESGSSPSILGRMSLLPKRLEDREGGAPASSSTAAAAAMDLSTTKEDGDSNEGGDDHPAATGISLVKPEVLFGKRHAEEDEDADDHKAAPVAPSMPFSPFLASGLAAAVAAMASGGNPAAAAVAPPSLGSNEMRNAFQEVLKLYGVPAEIAVAIAKNAQSAQGKLKTKQSS